MAEIQGKYFTLEEAKAVLLLMTPLLNRVQQVIDDLLKLQKEYSILQHRVGRNREEVPPWEISEIRDALQADEYEFRQLLDEIISYGCEVKGVNPLLLDFPSLRANKGVYLCWRQGEPTISHWHEFDTGFRSRKPLN